MIASYRDPRYAASIRIQQIQERSKDRPEGVPEELTHIHARRVARTAAGGVAIAGFAAMVIAFLVSVSGLGRGAAAGVHPTLVLAGAITLAVVTYVVARIAAASRFERRVWASFDGGQDELSRLARIEDDSVRRAAARLAGAGEKMSVALPMAGVSLLAPLSSHLVVWSVLGGGDVGSARWLEGFDGWIGASLLLVGISHMTLAYLCGRFADKVGASSLVALSHSTPMSGWAAFGWTVLASCVPGIIALAIPPMLVAATGIAFIPYMFRFMHGRVVDERTALDLG